MAFKTAALSLCLVIPVAHAKSEVKFPDAGVPQFIAKNLDVLSFSNSFEHQAEKKHRLAEMGFKTVTTDNRSILLEDDATKWSVNIDLIENSSQTALICFSEGGAQYDDLQAVALSIRSEGTLAGSVVEEKKPLCKERRAKNSETQIGNLGQPAKKKKNLPQN